MSTSVHIVYGCFPAVVVQIVTRKTENKLLSGWLQNFALSRLNLTAATLALQVKKPRLR